MSDLRSGVMKSNFPPSNRKRYFQEGSRDPNDAAVHGRYWHEQGFREGLEAAAKEHARIAPWDHDTTAAIRALSPLATAGAKQEPCDRTRILMQRSVNCGWIKVLDEAQFLQNLRIALDTEVEAGGPYLNNDWNKAPAGTQPSEEDVRSAVYNAVVGYDLTIISTAHGRTDVAVAALLALLR